MLQASASLFATYTVMLPIYARDILQIGPEGLGMLHSMIGAGSIIGTILFIAFSTAASRGVTILIESFMFPCLLIAFGLSTNVLISMILSCSPAGSTPSREPHVARSISSPWTIAIAAESWRFPRSQIGVSGSSAMCLLVSPPASSEHRHRWFWAA